MSPNRSDKVLNGDGGGSPKHRFHQGAAAATILLLSRCPNWTNQEYRSRHPPAFQLQMYERAVRDFWLQNLHPQNPPLEPQRMDPGRFDRLIA